MFIFFQWQVKQPNIKHGKCFPDHITPRFFFLNVNNVILTSS